MDKDILLKYREYHWQYFSLQAEQRLKAFHFYLIVSAILIGAFINLVGEEKDFKLAFIIPFVLTFISFIFHKIDLRARYMLKNAQNAIKAIDHRLISNNKAIPSQLNIFDYDDYLGKDKKAGMNYSKSFGYIFIVFGLLGFLAGVTYVIILIKSLL